MTDNDLKRSFAELKKLDRRLSPEFESMWAKPRPVRSPWRAALPIASVAAAAMLVLWCGIETTFLEATPMAAAPSAPTVDEPMSMDPAPLDFLLDISGSTSHAAKARSFDSNPLAGW